MIVVKASQYDSVSVSQDGTITIILKDGNIKEPVPRSGPQVADVPGNGLQSIWRSSLSLDELLEALNNQGYLKDGEWIGTARELRALYELLKRHKYVSAKLSRRTFFEAAKVSLKHTFACATSLNFADWDYQEELNNMYDSLSQWIRTEQNFDKN